MRSIANVNVIANSRIFVFDDFFKLFIKPVILLLRVFYVFVEDVSDIGVNLHTFQCSLSGPLLTKKYETADILSRV